MACMISVVAYVLRAFFGAHFLASVGEGCSSHRRFLHFRPFFSLFLDRPAVVFLLLTSFYISN